MKTANVGQYLFNSILPKEYRDNKRNFHNPKMLNDLLTRMARELPSGEYRDVLRDIFKLGSEVTYYEGSSFSLEDLKIPQKTKEARKALSSEVNQILSNPNFSRDEKNAAVIAHVQKSIKGLNKVMMAETKSKDSGLAKQVHSGSRGNAGDLQSLLLGDMLMEDAKGNAIPIPLLHGYAEGVDPAEYFSNSFGTRMGVLSTKKSVADSGYLCLSRDTKVRMSNGDSKSIQDIKVGDTVFGAEICADRSVVDVTAVFNNGPRTVRDYVFQCNHKRGAYTQEYRVTITATPEHKVLNSFEEIVPLSEVHAIPVTQEKLVYVLRSVSEPRIEDTYDIEVDNEHHLFVLANGAIVSNSKRMKQVAHRQVVTQDDCGTQRSIEVSARDPENIGAVLAEDVDGYKIGTPITASVLKRLKGDTIHVRSALTCDAPEGLCAKCVGIRESGELPSIGDNIGIIAGQSVGEKATQKALCLREGTLVRMADLSSKPIEKIKVGDEVVGSTVDGELFPVKVLNTFDQGLQDVHRYSYKKGQSKEFVHLECTKDHVILANTSKSSCKEEVLNEVVRPLRAGYQASKFFAVLQQGVYEPEFTINEPLALAMGLLYGDGCRSETTPILSCADPSQMQDLDIELASVGMHSVKRGRTYDWALSLKSPTGTATRGSGGRFIAQKESRNPLIALQERLDTRTKYCHEKYLCDEILSTWDTESVCKLVAGYFASDGSVYRNKKKQLYISFGSTSRSLLEGFKFLLDTRLGMHSSMIYLSGKAGTGNRKHNFYELKLNRLTEVQRFNELIGEYIPGVKRDKLNTYLSEANYSRHVPFFRAKRKHDEKLGYCRCFDIEVDHQDHLFLLANGLTVSNSMKHSAGRATGNVKGDFVEGYDLIEQLMSVPKSFTDAAVTSSVDGTVELIEPAPQGGKNITIDGNVFHVPTNMNPIVKIGDPIEPGDLLSNGIPDPSQLIKYKGIGETRRIFTDQLKEATGASRRNTEVMAKAFVDYIRITEPDLYPNTAPDDIMKYSDLAKRWTPRKGFRTLAPRASVGQYLETPVAQYTIGTHVTPKVANELSRRGFKKIDTHQDEPPFVPVMVPSVRALTHSDDWQERMGGYHLKDSLLDAASRGMKSQVHSTSFIPGILKGTDFGSTLRETGTY